MKKIQRTLIVTGDGLAGQVGDNLATLFARAGEPAEAVAIVPSAETRFEQALKKISQLAVRDSLLEKQWQLDRLEEVAVIQIVDVSAIYPVNELAARISESAYRELRLATTNLVLAIVPELEYEGHLRQLTSHYQTIAISSVCEHGLLDPEMLTTTCARLVHVLVTTPLRDSLNWLAEMNGHPGLDETQVNCMGLATWEWSPSAEQQRLALQWVYDALKQWQRPLPEKEGANMGGLALNWLAALEPETLARHCAPGLTSPAVPPSWHYPMPWRIREYFQNNEREDVELESDRTTLSKLVQAHRPGPLLDLGEELLDRNPDPGPARLKLLADAIEDGLEVLENRLADREDTLTERVAALSAQWQVLQEELERLLSGWPGAGFMSWLWLTSRPWRWPSLVWTYWQLRNLALVIEQIEREKEQWERQQQIAAVTGDLYHSLKGETTLFLSKVEEVADMLGNMGKTVEEELEKAGESEVTAVLYGQLVEAPGLEAEQAAATIGGLGQQLSRPDDIFLESLLEAGLERMQEVLSLSTVDVLRLLYPTPDGLAEWWASQMEAASPLWHSNQGMTPVAEQQELLLVCGAGVLSLKQILGEQLEGRWIETTDLERLIALRLRGPVAVPDAVTVAQTDEELSEVNDEL